MTFAADHPLLTAVTAAASRPRRTERRASVELVDERGRRGLTVDAHFGNRRWGIEGSGDAAEAAPRTGLFGDGLVPLEVAVLAPVELPVWGRWHDDWRPIHCDAIDDQRVRVVVEHAEDRAVVGSFVMNVKAQIVEMLILPPLVVRVDSLT